MTKRDGLHSQAKIVPVPPKYAHGQRVWFVSGRGKALQPKPQHLGQYGRVDAIEYIGDGWVYSVRCRGVLDVVDEECLTRCYAEAE